MLTDDEAQEAAARARRRMIRFIALGVTLAAVQAVATITDWTVLEWATAVPFALWCLMPATAAYGEYGVYRSLIGDESAKPRHPMTPRLRRMFGFGVGLVIASGVVFAIEAMTGTIGSTLGQVNLGVAVFGFAMSQAARIVDRVRRRPTLIGRVFFWLLDQAHLHTRELCRSYGGPAPEGSVRLCERPRWHWDSHAYGRWELPNGRTIDSEAWYARKNWPVHE